MIRMYKEIVNGGQPENYIYKATSIKADQHTLPVPSSCAKK